MACERVQFSKKTHGDGAGIVRKLDANRKRIPATCGSVGFRGTSGRCASSRNALAIGIQFPYDSGTIPRRFFRELDPFASHVAVAALAIATWVFLIVPLWRRWRPRLLLLSKNNLLKKRLAAATIVLLVFAVGLWMGWHKDAISARLSRWHSELTQTIPSASPSPSPLTLTESSVEAMAQTPASSPSLVDQLLREGIELREIRGDTTHA